MPTVEFPISKYVAKVGTPEAVEAMAADLENTYLDDLLTNRKRPALIDSGWVTNGEAVWGLYYFRDADYLIIAQHSKIFCYDRAGNGTDITPTVFNSTYISVPVFTDNGTYLVMTDPGGALMYWPGDSSIKIDYLANVATAAGAPAKVSGLAVIDNYIIAVHADSQNWNFSETGQGAASPLYWRAQDEETCGSMPDIIQSVKVLNRELIFIGNYSMEYWYPNPNEGDDFIRVNDLLTHVGTLSSESVCMSLSSTGEMRGLYFLDQHGQIVRLNGRTVSLIGAPIRGDVSRIRYLDDCKGMAFFHDGKPFYAFIFPRENVTWVYDETGDGGWAKWGYWNSQVGRMERLPVTTALTIPEWRKTFFAALDEGKLLLLDGTTYRDDFYSGSAIRQKRKTGFLNFGNSARPKFIRYLAFQVKIGVDNPTVPEPSFILKVFKDGSRQHYVEHVIEIPTYAEDGSAFLRTPPLGLCQTIAWELTHSDATEFNLIKAFVEFSEVVAE